MSERVWTRQQRNAIEARGGQVLVSAAAGSGKTAVLVERVIRLLCDEEHPVDVDRLLVVTFSNAAAAEMKQRMAARLAAMLRQTPGDLHLQRQQALLATAQISTIHSFCLELVRQNFQNLAVSPDFSIADEKELDMLRQDCAQACIEQFYEQDKTGVFAQLVELLAGGRDDARLLDTIFRIYNFSRSHPFYRDWLREALDMYDPAVHVAETVWGRSLLHHARESLAHAVQAVTSALEQMAGDEKMQKAYGAAFAGDLAQLQECLAAVTAGDWDKSVRLVQGFSFAKLGPLRGDDPVKTRVQTVRKNVKGMVQELAEKYLNATAREFADDIADLRPKMEMLFSLVGAFDELLESAKAEKRRLDFSDLEHLALQLLVEKTPRGYVRTARAEEIARRFDYVLVDEYQDTNEVQDLIFSCVSRNQQNLFMVGDVKQSIYGFRQAMPQIFMAKKEKFFPYDTGFYPAKIILDTNFRSRAEVTDGINYLFRLLMSKRMGEIDYNDEESLRCGAQYPLYGGACPELLLLDASEDDKPDTVAVEAAEIAKTIRDMLTSGYMVAQDGAMRPATPRDFCILLRSPKGRADTYVKQLTLHGVPAWAENAGGFLLSREVASVVALLRALDNPLLDIELVAAMLGPLFDFDDDDIARIRLAARGVPFYSACVAHAQSGCEKTRAFLRLFDDLRAHAAMLPADRLLLRLYEQTNALAVVRAMPMGAARAANLSLLAEYAASYHTLGYKRLSGFVGFLARVQEHGGDLAPANTLGDSANVVRIMSVHRSKGLEFPVVFLADMARQFNQSDLREPTLLHARFGFACVRRDPVLRKQFATVPLQAIRLESRRSRLSEEMRILYVALTRAKEKLFLTCVQKGSLQKKLAGLLVPCSGGRLPPYAVGHAASYADWVLMALLHHPGCNALRELGRCEPDTLAVTESRWQVRYVAAGKKAPQQPAPETCVCQRAQPDEALVRTLSARIQYQYPHRNRTQLPAKLAVSDIAKAQRDVAHAFSTRPRFLANEALTPAEKGSAMHKFMQFADYAAARGNLDAEIGRMRQQGFLSAAEVESLDRPRLRAFFESALAARIFASETVYRELRFMRECGPAMLGDAVQGMDPEARIVLQGVADCVFVENGAAVIVDYKTDAVREAGQLRERYGKQLELYRALLAESLGMPVSACILYSFALGQAVVV